MVQLALGYPNGFSLVVKNALQKKLNFLNKLVDLYFLRKEFQCTHSYHQLRSFMKLMCPAVTIDLLQFSFLAASAHPLLPSNGYPLIAPIGIHLITIMDLLFSSIQQFMWLLDSWETVPVGRGRKGWVGLGLLWKLCTCDHMITLQGVHFSSSDDVRMSRVSFTFLFVSCICSFFSFI